MSRALASRNLGAVIWCSHLRPSGPLRARQGSNPDQRSACITQAGRWSYCVKSEEETLQTIDKLTRSERREIEATLISEIERSERAGGSVAALALTEALGRLRNGSYGQCIHCVNQIPVDRLLVLPEITHCLGCKGAG